MREIFSMLIEEHKMSTIIASELNRRGVFYKGIKRTHWYPGAVERILKNPKYAGIGVYGRRTQRLGARGTFLPTSKWTTVPGSWKPIVDLGTFVAAQRVLQDQTANQSDENLLDELRRVLAQHNCLTERLVKADLPNRSIGTYARRFRSLSEAFARAGYFGSKLRTTETRRALWELRSDLMMKIIKLHEGEISIFRANHRAAPGLRLNNGQSVTVHVCKSHRIESGAPRWTLNVAPGESDLITLVARLDTSNHGFLDFHVLPALPNPRTWTMQLDDPWFRMGGQACTLTDLVTAVKMVAERKSAGGLV